MTETKSFTLRLPIDLLEEIENCAGERSRSEVIIQLLRDAFGMGSNTDDLASRVAVLEQSIEEIKLQISKPARKVRSQQIPVEPEQLVLTDEDDKKPLLERVTEIPIEAQKVTSPNLLNILKREDPEKGWAKEKLAAYRKSKHRQNWWHAVGRLKFTYACKENQGNLYDTHYWWLIESSSRSEEI